VPVARTAGTAHGGGACKGLSCPTLRAAVEAANTTTTVDDAMPHRQAREVSGTVRVKLPGSKRFVVLDAAQPSGRSFYAQARIVWRNPGASRGLEAVP
jgi:hypothetical protein